MRICAIGLRGIPGVMGGIETHCEQLYPQLAKLDDSIEICVLGRGGHVRSGQYGRVRVFSLWSPRRKGVEALVHTLIAILYARLALHPRVVHLHGVGPGFFTPFARLLGFRVVATHHAQDYDRAKWGRFGRAFLKAGEWMIARFASDVVCVSQHIEDDLAARYPARRSHFHTIRNAPPAELGRVPADESVLASLGLASRGYILCVGRLDPSKGFHDAIEAFERARPPGLKLVIAGDSMGSDDYARRLRTQSSAAVVFAGRRSAGEVRALYQHAALFLHPSHLEGFAIVLLEALSANAPVLVSDIAPHREASLDPACYFPCGDVAALAARLAKGRFEALRCGRQSAILAEHTWEKAARRYHDVLVRAARLSRAAPQAEQAAGR